MTTILPSATVIRSRKSRLTTEKSVAKTPVSSHFLVDISPELVEFFVNGVVKKKTLLPVLLFEVQSLFEFLPRGACAGSCANS